MIRVVRQGLNDAGTLIEIMPEFAGTEEVQLGAGIPERARGCVNCGAARGMRLLMDIAAAQPRASKLDAGLAIS
jgi:hypothetical protein